MLYQLYHGTKKEKAEKILRDNKFVFRTSKKHYLGNGVYFYDNCKKAYWWPIIFYKIEKEQSRVLKVDIVVDDKDILNFNCPDDDLKFKKFVEEFKKSGYSLLKNTNEDDTFELARKRCFFIDSFCDEYPHKLVIGTVINDNFFAQFGIIVDPDLQFCVRDPNIIKKIEMENSYEY